ncbi:hypothetical protein G6514_003721 [Epicoccum nigrum]|nr:hypothetical protein G6514_003721 [Epicoccum nigrum]
MPPSPEIGMGVNDVIDVSDIDLDNTGVEDGASENFARQSSTSVEQHDEGGRNEDCTCEPDQTQPAHHSLPESAQRADSEPTDIQLMTPASTGPPARRSARAKSTLIYDQKYHPMDDVIRPSQAAKRRSLHGESPLVDDRSESYASEDSTSDAESMNGDQESNDDDSQPPARGRKRKRSLSPELTRRSSRRKTTPKVSYNMRIHPQDSDLRRIGACDGSNSLPESNKTTGYHSSKVGETDGPSTGLKELHRPMLANGTNESSYAELSKPSQELTKQQVSVMVAAAGSTTKLTDTCPNLSPNLAYLTSNRDSWPKVQGLPFCIYTERMEDQLDAEAAAASPLITEGDGKENNETDSELVPSPDPLNDISIIPASQYQRSSGLRTVDTYHSMARNDPYAQPVFEAFPYGLGWGDGIHEVNNDNTHNRSLSDYMRIQVSGENLPQSDSQDTRFSSSDVPASSSPVRNLEGIELRR